MQRLLVRTALLLGLLAILVPVNAASAATPVLLGQTAISSTGTCGLCSVLQFEDSGSPNTYEIPTDGVLTKFLIYVGDEVNAADKVQLRTFRKVNPTSATVVSAGAQHSLSGATAGVSNSFLDRVPAHAGDVLGARFDIAAHSADATPPSFSTGSGSDLFAYQLGSTSDPGVGETFSPSFGGGTGYRANVAAWLEPDGDHDGYGDISQDLCPGSPVTTGACTGSLFGSALQGEPTFRGACGYACLRVQKTVGGASAAAPFDGVVVRWRVLSAPAGDYRIRVLGPAGGTKYTILRSSDAGTVGSDGQFSLSSFATRLPIPMGGYVGLAPPPFAGPQDILAAPSSTWMQVDDGADGSSGDFAGWSAVPGEALYDADIEPDADHDGYGDVSQDSCPGSASVHEGPCPPEPLLLRSRSVGRPTIAHFEVSPKRFHVKPAPGSGGRRSKTAKGGTKLKLTLSEGAKVLFTIEAKAMCKKAKVARRCKPGFHRVQSFSSQLSSGPSSVPYSGRYPHGGKQRVLSPGAYRVTAVATDAAGASSSPARAPFTILP
jgi:hypothetical protein